MEYSNCKKDWVSHKTGISYCPIHKTHFYAYKHHECQYYKADPLIADGTKNEKRDILFEQGVEQGVTSLTRKSVLKIDDKHSHAFRFIVRFSDDLNNWSGRDRTLKSRGFKAVRKGGIGKVWMSDCFGFKCWFADKSITIYFPSWKRYFVDSARTGYNYAIADLHELLLKLEDVFGVSFKVDGHYVFKCSGQHHGLIHNDLARMYNRNKDKLNVYDKKGELWLLIDNSNPEGFGLNEIETVHPKTAVHDMDNVVSEFFNQTKDTQLMPNDVLNMFKQVAELQTNESKKWSYYGSMMESHVDAIKQLGEAVGKLDNRIGKLGESQSKKQSSPQSRKDKVRKFIDKYK